MLHGIVDRYCAGPSTGVTTQKSEALMPICSRHVTQFLSWSRRLPAQPASRTRDCCEQAGMFALSLLLSPAVTDGTASLGEQLSSCLIKPKRPRNSQHGHGIRQRRGKLLLGCGSAGARTVSAWVLPVVPSSPGGSQPQLCGQLAPGYSLVTSCNCTVMYLSI